MDKVTDLILIWRKLELSGWKILLQKCLSRIRKQTVNYWVGAVMVSGTKREEVERTLIRFMEAGSLNYQSINLLVFSLTWWATRSLQSWPP